MFAILGSTAGAVAQVASGGAGTPQAQHAYAQWRRLPQSEVNCVDRALKHQGATLWILIQRGVDPSSTRVGGIRSECQAQARGAGPQPNARGGAQAMADAAADVAADKAAPADAKAAAEKAAADQVATEKVATEKAAADKVKAEKEKAAAAAEKAAREKASAEKAAAEKVAADKAVAEKVAAAKAAADKAASDMAKAEAERVKSESVEPVATAVRPQPTAERQSPDVALAASVTESRLSFLWGLIAGPVIFSLGGFVFLLMQRRKQIAAAELPVMNSKDLGRLAAAMVAELKRRDTVAAEPVTSDRGRRVEESAPLH